MNLSPGINAEYLLSKDDPKPVEIVNELSDHPLLLICEHAGQCIPTGLNGLGVDQVALDGHIGWDIGAGAVTRIMAQALGAPAVFQRYSRLVIDCNRPYEAKDAIPEISDGTKIPGNMNLDAMARSARLDQIFTPFHNSVAALFKKSPRRITLSIHSFTPEMDGVFRPWDIGFLFRNDTETSALLSRRVGDIKPDLAIGMNEPYQIDDASDWFVPHHGEARGVPHSLIEIRNDHLQTAEGQTLWAEILVTAINRYLKDT